MNDIQSSSALWESMPDQKKIEWLATKVMGWRAGGEGYWLDGDGKEVACWNVCFTNTYDVKSFGLPWNPLSDWNHWREVEEKIMEDESLWKFFCKQLAFQMDFLNQDLTAMQILMKADLPTRCKAVFLAMK